jgi:porphobilinogen synthase
LFGLPEKKDEVATGAWADDGIVQKATRAIKAAVPGLMVIGDVCLCEYMSHGHCGIVLPAANPGGPKTVVTTGSAAAATEKFAAEAFEIANDPTLDILAKTAVSQARAGMDIIAPSDMMDGRVGAIRTALDANGFANIPILSYAAKFASGFYGVRRIRDDRSRGEERLDRPRSRDAGVADIHSARRSQYHPDLLREGRGEDPGIGLKAQGKTSRG